MRWKQIILKSISTILILAVVAAAMAWLAGVFRKGRIGPKPVQVKAALYAGPATRAVEMERPRTAEVAGSIQAEVRSAISSRLIANILQMRVNAGDRVKAGDVLVLLDEAAPRARMEQTRQALLAAEAQRDLAQSETNRVTQAAEARAVSASERDTWVMRLASAKADVARVQQALQEARVSLEDARLLSPISGVVIDRQAEPGEQASPGRTLLTIYDPAKMRVEAYVREAYLGRLAPGQKVAVHVDALRQTRQATIDQIVPAADPSSRSFLVKAGITEGTDLMPGMYARLQLPLESEKVLSVPASAVVQVGQLSFVDVVADGTLERRAVRLGRREEGRVEILAGLEPGQTVANR
jgi:membrane fusion protein, multidrug efflux system